SAGDDLGRGDGRTQVVHHASGTLSTAAISHVIPPWLVRGGHVPYAPPQHNGSKSISIFAAAASASARVAATHTAIGSPTWRALSTASTGCTDDLNPGTRRQP